MTTVAIPGGYWELEASENPAPISPMAGSFYLDALTAGVRHLCSELGLLLDTAQWREIGGWVYLQSVPFVADEAAIGERLGRCVEAVESDLTDRYLDRWDQEWRPWLVRRAAELDAVDRGACDDKELAAHLDEVVAFVFAATDVHCLLHGPNATMLGELVAVCTQLLNWSEAQALDLVSGTSTASTEPAARLAELAALGGDADFDVAFDAFRAEFGYRATRYEVIEPSFAEQPELLLRMIRDQRQAGFDPAESARRADERRAQARAAARAELAERHPDQRARFERVLDRATRFYPVREDNEVWTQTVPLGLARIALLAVGDRLVSTGVLDERDDVFLLQLDEARQALRTGERAQRVVATRRLERERAFAASVPASYGTAPPPPDFSALPEAVAGVHLAIGWVIDRIVAPAATALRQRGDVLEGLPGSPGRYTGPVRVVRTASDLGRLQAGDVMVCPAVAPSWSIAFGAIGAVVADTGGVLSHLSIIAREFGIPAVVGTGNAAALLVDGQRVTVDGAAGTVTVHP
ncbi:MAG TPA: PEP-utilizing enzyme [Sporichthyaceae bacterium]|jgi:pyruvate,water dikinase